MPLTRIAHLSDLHFGRVVPAVLEALTNDLAELAPDAVVISGDITQRARPPQFREAQAFFERLRKITPRLLFIPGNHDVPLLNPLNRLFFPFRNYRRFVTHDFFPRIETDTALLLGANSARRYKITGGAISPAQVATLAESIRSRGERLSILAVHHPLLNPPGIRRSDLLSNPDAMLRAFGDDTPDIILVGHLHRSHIAESSVHFTSPHRGTLIVQAGSATSNRLRGEANAYNVISFENATRVAIGVRHYSAQAFVETARTRFVRSDEVWRFVDEAE